MKHTYLVGLIFSTSLMFTSPSWAGDPVPLPCDPATNCPPVDPCKINPDRCKDKGGPIKFESGTYLDEPSAQFLLSRDAGPLPGEHASFKSDSREGVFDGKLCISGERESMSPLILADVQGCFDSCSTQAKTCLRGCDNISDGQKKASCYEGCGAGQESCRARCK